MSELDNLLSSNRKVLVASKDLECFLMSFYLFKALFPGGEKLRNKKKDNHSKH